MQTALNNNGFNPGPIDGIFGNMTLEAVKGYQKANGLVVDGIAGPKTLGKLMPASTTTTSTITRLLAVGSHGDDVKLVQTNLNKNGFSLVVDGIFGAKTQAAVKEYQKSNGLAVDGVVGPNTSAKLIPAPAATPTAPTTPTSDVDVVAAASLTDKEAVFEKSIGTAGKWIIATTKDLTFDHALVLDGHFTNGKNVKDADGKDTGIKAIQRKIALYTQDDKHNVTARFNLTAPKITILSFNASIQHGTFKGDIYVSAQNFSLVDMVVEGNVYFTNKGAKDTFKMDSSSYVRGKKELKLLPETVDAYASASKVLDDKAAFEKAISSQGNWIIAMLNNLTFDHDLVLDGDFKKAATDTAPQRKLAIYAHDVKNSKLTTGRFILTAPSLTIKSANANITKGMFKGDLYVTVPNFKLVDAIIDGNVYFANENVQKTFTKDATSIITGKQEIKVKQ
jgi:peptidoglycan hydrolase-like protein with peptidoglycan-binding domain/YHS domain-containing protein